MRCITPLAKLRCPDATHFYTQFRFGSSRRHPDYRTKSKRIEWLVDSIHLGELQAPLNGVIGAVRPKLGALHPVVLIGDEEEHLVNGPGVGELNGSGLL
jgi:hypothetical protein